MPPPALSPDVDPGLGWAVHGVALHNIEGGVELGHVREGPVGPKLVGPVGVQRHLIVQGDKETHVEIQDSMVPDACALLD